MIRLASISIILLVQLVGCGAPDRTMRLAPVDAGTGDAMDGKGGASGQGGASGTGGVAGEAGNGSGGSAAGAAGAPSACPGSKRYYCTETTALDSTTGLVWQRKAADGGGMEWDKAMLYCTGGTRLPSRDELVGIWQGPPNVVPFIDIEAFPTTADPWIFWSKSSTGCDVPDAEVVKRWAVTYAAAGNAYCVEETALANVRCVSGP